MASGVIYMIESFKTTTLPAGRRALLAGGDGIQGQEKTHRVLLAPITPENCYTVRIRNYHSLLLHLSIRLRCVSFLTRSRPHLFTRSVLHGQAGAPKSILLLCEYLS